MNKTWIKIALPLLALGLGVAGMVAIKATADPQKEKEPLDTRPTVKVESLAAKDYQVQITGHGELSPVESTQLAAQVSGEVVSMNPNFIAGGLVERGDVLFSIEKDTYQAAVLQAEAALSQAKANLIEERARAEVAKREARNLPDAKVTDLYLRKPQLLSAQASVKSAEAQLKIARRDLANCEIRAPYNALIVSRSIGEGQFVNQGASIGKLHNIESAEVIFPVAGFDSAFLPNQLKGTPVTLINQGVRGGERSGVIDRDLGVVDQATRMSHLVVRIDDPYGLSTGQPAMKFGQYVELHFNGQTLANIYRLPQDLVSGRKVWVVNEAQELEPKAVEVLREEGEYFLIDKGLQDNDRVVLTLPEYPQEGMEVKIAQADSAQMARQDKEG